MREDFLHYVWKFKKFNFLDLKTREGKSINIIHPGNHNTDAGPDFLNAKLIIDNTKWAGSVEMHLKASDWHRHKHSNDKAYNNVILHVVWENDVQILDQNEKTIPSLVLLDKVEINLQNKYLRLINSQLWIPCQENIDKVKDIKIRSWIEHLMVDRLEEKIIDLTKALDELNNNWEQMLFVLIAKNLGLKKNSEPLETLAKSVPVDILFKHSDVNHQIESILFGQSSLLHSKQKDDYSKSLLKEYTFLAKKYGLKKPKYLNWKLLRLRPSNFPSIRISQLASIYSSNNLMFDILLNGSLNDLKSLFENIVASKYWDNHYLFEKESESNKPKKLGKNRTNIILINAIVPLIFLYGKTRGETKYIDKALALLELIPAESNQIINNWKKTGIGSKSAFDTQALIHLKTRYCNKQKCLQCAIGNDIMNQESKT